MSGKGVVTRAKAQTLLANPQDCDDNVSGKSVPKSKHSHNSYSGKSRKEDALEVVDELIKIQEEETALIISCAQAKAAAEKAEATAEAKRAEVEAEAKRAEVEAEAKRAAADGRLAQVQEEAKRKELEIKKRLLEDRLSMLSSRSSRASSRSSRLSVSSLSRPLPNKEAVEKWLQVKEADEVVHSIVLEPCVNFPRNDMSSMKQECCLPYLDGQPSYWPREDNCHESPRDAKTEPSKKIGVETQNFRDVMCHPPRNIQPATGRYESYKQPFENGNVSKLDGNLLDEKKMSREKMPARVLSSLPNFSGDLEQWPAWIAEYKRSTVMNDYTDLENLQRLQKSLTGKAKEMISALLIYPENVPEIINLLERRFGRPEIIIKNLIASVRNRPPTKDYKPETLVGFSDMVRNLVVTVKSLRQDHYLFNPQLMEELTEKLSTNMKLNWGMFVTSPQSQLKHPVGLDVFSSWLSSMADAATICAPSTSTLPGTYKSTTRNDTNQKNFVFVQEESGKRSGKRMCICCKKEEHSLEECKQFICFDVQRRWDTVKNCRVCFNCLKIKHRAANCRKKSACGVNGCTYSHHKLLHVVPKEEDENKPQPFVLNEEPAEHVGFQEEPMARVLLRVLPITLVGKNEKRIKTFALIDDGSTISVIEKSLAEELDINGPTRPVSFSWTDGSVYTEGKSQTVTVTVLSDDGETLTLNNVKTLSELQLPTQTMNVDRMKKKWPHLQEIPEEVFHRGRPRILIGHEHIHLTVPRQVIIGPANAPVALKSKLGWTINGPTGKTGYETRVDSDFVMFKSEINSELSELNALVKRSFEQDFIEISAGTPKKNEDQSRAETILKNTCSQTKEGYWQIGLLWKDENPQLPDSRSVAWRRLNYVENKMNENSKLSEQYHQQIASYAEKGYAKQLNPDQVKTRSEKTWYLPHFPVHNPRKPDKFRFVFDAASKSHGQSLNQCLLPGPNLFNNLTAVLFQFRKYKIAYAADIEEMFLRIKIIAEDQDALRFLWRGENRNIEEWCMTSMIFGAVCSPTSAIYVMRKNAEKHGKENEQAALAIKEQFYMDDYLDSRETVAEAANLVEGVVNICKKGKLNLRNFVSNSPELMDSLPKTSWSKHYLQEDVGITGEDTERVLGLHWNFHNDVFCFKVNFVKVKREIVYLKESPTKRQVLQAVMSIYDPLGFITPITMKGKILIQSLWKLNVQWDEKIPRELEKSWEGWMKDVKKSENLKIPRCYNLTSSCSLQLHIFCDASEKGFCSVAYFRVENQGQVELAFVLARSRVAPLQATTIPRLELQAAVLGSRIATLIHRSHKLQITKTYFWTDSRIVWCWIQASHKQKSIYLANRLKEILNTSEKKQWRWLPTTENVADEATRESTKSLSNDDCRWLQGPAFLRKQKQSWPKIESQPQKQEYSEVVLINTTENNRNPIIDMDRFSKYTRLVRTIAWVQRFIFNARNKNEKNNNASLSVEELEQAEKTCFRLSQHESFPEELKCLKENKPIPRESRLSKLSPVLSGNLVKMRGRTEYGNQISQNLKTPIILDPKQRLVVLLIQREHEETAHQGQETVANNLRQKFWIVRLKQAIKSCWANCKKCQLRRTMPKTPEMAPLPAYRLEPYGRPFTCTALDYFGPLEVTVGRRREKRYGALFTCLSVRAIHLELAASLNTDSAIQAIRRFAARRGYPKELRSDNGTNFKAAEKELRACIETFDSEELKKFCAGKMMKWSFLPPASPHMGGAHERLVQSVKKCLSVVLNSQAPKEETLVTLLCEVEYIINNRPLTLVSEDPADELPLTPNHFLLGGVDKLAPAVIIKEKHLRNQWKIAQDLADKFWKRWLREYIPILNKRSKWHSKQPNIEVGNLVLITDENLARGKWTKGVVEATYPGRDGQVRVADIRTTTGVWRRPTTKLVKLMA